MINRRHLLTGAALLATSAAIPRAWAQAPSGPFKLDPLPYAPSKNEPHIDAQTMELHYGKHHASYVNNLNAALGQNAEAARMPLHEMLAKLGQVPESIRATIRNSGGGHVNHTMFWQIMGGSGGEPSGELKSAIDRDLGGFQKFQADFNTAGERQFGSGWVFVTVERDGRLALTSRPNQDTPLMDGKLVLMGGNAHGLSPLAG
jgi:Fe-Mn family superoxide dismutase